MQPQVIEYQPHFPIELLAHFVRSLPQHDIARLVELVPELKSIDNAKKEAIPQDQTELINYFSELVPDNFPPIPDEEALIEGLTFGEFLLLPEEEKNRIWSEAHAKAEAELGNREIEVQPDAIPAG